MNETDLSFINHAIASAKELNADKAYLVIVQRNRVSMHDCELLREAFHELGLRASVIRVEGKPDESIGLYELPRMEPL